MTRAGTQHHAGPRKHAPRLATVLAAVAVAVAAVATAGCGGDDEPATTPSGTAALPTRTQATLVLDFLPSAVHAGIYRAVAAGYYEDNNVDLTIIEPTSTADTLKLIDAGKADVGIADAIDVAGQLDRAGAQAILALVQRPLGGLVTLRPSGITSPRALEGRKVGVTGVPSDAAILETIIRDAGGDPARADVVTVGFNGVQNLEGGTIDAFTGYWPADAVQVQQDGRATRTFKLDEHGGPAYPGLVTFSTRKRIAEDGPLMRAFVDATVRGYTDTIEDPQRSLDDLLAENGTLQRDVTEAQLAAYGPLFQADAAAFGTFDARRLRALSTFLVEHDLIDAPFTPERFATSAFLPPGS